MSVLEWTPRVMERSTFAWHPTSIVIVKQPCGCGQRFNPNHDPSTGQFSSGGGSVIDHGNDPAVATNVLHAPGRALGGSNGARVYKGKDGVSRVVKLYREPGQGQSESLANDLYKRLNSPAPESFTFEHEGDTYYAAPMIPGVNASRELGNLGLTKERAETVLKGFAGDVLVANWDVGGLTLDNLVETPDGKIVRVDNGAAFLFRAMGERKPEGLLTDVTEWESFAPGGRNRTYAKIFDAAGIDRAEHIPDISAQISRIEAVRDEVGGWSKYVTERTPSMDPNDRAMIIRMLEARTTFLSKQRKLVRFNPNHAPAGSPAGGQFTSAGNVGTIEDAKAKVDAAKAKVDATAMEITHQSAIKAWDAATDAYINHPENPHHYYPSEHEKIVIARGTLDEAKAKVDRLVIEYDEAYSTHSTAWSEYIATGETDPTAKAAVGKAESDLAVVREKLKMFQDAYREHPENVMHLGAFEHERVVKIASALKRPYDEIKTEVETAKAAYYAANKEATNVSYNYSATPEEREAANNKASDAYSAFSSWEQAALAHPDNPINKQKTALMEAKAGKVPLDELRARVDVAKAKLDAANDAYMAAEDGTTTEKAANEAVVVARNEHQNALDVYESHPEHPVNKLANQPIEELEAARDQAGELYDKKWGDYQRILGDSTSTQEQIDAAKKETSHAFDLQRALMKAVNESPQNPKNMSYDELVDLRDELETEHTAIRDQYWAAQKEGAYDPAKVGKLETDTNAAYSKWNKIDELVREHPDNPDNAVKEEEQDPDYDSGESDYENNDDTSDSEPESSIDTYYCSACEDAEPALIEYTGSGHGHINGYLRNPGMALGNQSKVQNQVSDIDAAIASVKPLSEPMEVWRGANAKRLGFSDARKLEGFVFTDKGFTSTSTSEYIARSFGSNAGEEHQVLFKIALPKGMRVLDMQQSGIRNENEGEQEFLLPRGGTFEVGKMHMQQSEYYSHTVYDVIYHPPEEHWVPPNKPFVDEHQLPLELPHSILDIKKYQKLLAYLRFNPNHDPDTGKFSEGSGGGQAWSPTMESNWSEWNDVSVWESHEPQHVDTKYCPECEPNYGAIVEYVQDGHRPINNLLRHGATGKDPMGNWKTADEYQRYISGLDTIIASTPATKNDMVVYRGVNIAKLNPDDLKVGNSFEDKGFVSTSKQQSVALAGFSHTAINQQGTVFAIRIPQGSHVLDVMKATPKAAEAIDGEEEVLLPRGGKYRITRDRVAKDFSSKYRIIEMTYEPPPVTLVNLNTRFNPNHDPSTGQFTSGVGSGTTTIDEPFPVGATSNIINPPPHATHYKDPDDERLAAAKTYCPGCQGWVNDAASLSHYTGSGYREINALARGRPDQSWADDPEIIAEVKGHVAAMDRLIASVPPTEEATVVYRGVNAERLGFATEQDMVGKTITDPGFASTSKDRDRAADFADMRGHRMAVLKIELPQGVQALDLERAAKGMMEKEVILPRGSRFEVIEQSDTIAYNERPNRLIPVFTVRYHPPGSN